MILSQKCICSFCVTIEEVIREVVVQPKKITFCIILQVHKFCDYRLKCAGQCLFQWNVSSTYLCLLAAKCQYELIWSVPMYKRNVAGLQLFIVCTNDLFSAVSFVHLRHFYCKNHIANNLLLQSGNRHCFINYGRRQIAARPRGR